MPSQGRPCPICLGRVNNIRRHVHEQHLPWGADPSKVCFTCGYTHQQRSRIVEHLTETCPQGDYQRHSSSWVPFLMTLLQLIVQALGFHDVHQLLLYTVTNGLYSHETDPNGLNAEDAFILNTIAGFTPGEKEFHMKPPSHWACLIHWRILAQLLHEPSATPAFQKAMEEGEKLRTRLTDQRSSRCQSRSPQQKQRSRCQSPSPQQKRYSQRQSRSPQQIRRRLMKGIDAHFHLDVSMKRRIPRRLLEEHLSHLDAAIPCFAYPESWPGSYTCPILHGTKAYTVGFHPTRAHLFNCDTHQKFEELLTDPNVKAVGEVGLDYLRGQEEDEEETQKRIWQQHRLFRAAVELALKLKLPLVLHLRDPDGDPPNAALDALAIMQEMGVPPSHHVYLHCFTYGERILAHWKSHFHHLWVGVSPILLQRRRNSGYKETIPLLHSTQLLLETDAPYLAPDNWNQPRTPTLIFEVAHAVAELKGTSAEAIIHHAAEAAAELYSL